ncbi:hypothetical protein LTR53_008785 [Teratosphaeriaceae sp. CCFEE 6253]|nr:hypothetical protein LTR53_008785 [Teratosphaeriaceae sp. CCFEE 6253]
MPDQKSLHDLAGKWSMSRDLSSDVSPVLEIQGFNALIRQAVSYAPVNLAVTQSDDGSIHIAQSTTASIPAVKEEWYPRDPDSGWRETKDAFLGKVRSRSRWVRVSELQGRESFFTEGLGEGDEVIESEVAGLGSTEWKAVQTRRQRLGWYMSTRGREEKVARHPDRGPLDCARPTQSPALRTHDGRRAAARGPLIPHSSVGKAIKAKIESLQRRGPELSRVLSDRHYLATARSQTVTRDLEAHLGSKRTLEAHLGSRRTDLGNQMSQSYPTTGVMHRTGSERIDMLGKE